MSKKAISYCLWGSDKKYSNGLLRNINTIRNNNLGYDIIIYTPKNYEIFFYDSIYKYNHKKINIGQIEIDIPEKDFPKLMFYRFVPASNPDIDVMYSRDLDSPITAREIDAMKEFEESDKMFHVMRDHVFHGARILGGTWGAKKGAIPEMAELVQKHLNDFDNIKQDNVHFEGWYRDQHFLEQIIYPKIRDKALIHDAFNLYPDEEGIRKPFPTPRESDEFVGMIINADGTRNEDAHKILRDAERQI